MPDVLSLEDVAHALRTQRCPTDRAFDRFLPGALRDVSAEYWTPLRVAVRAAGWFEELEIRSVVDIGAGAGKFCVATALASSCRLVGFEQRRWLVEAARTLADTFRVGERVEFVQGALGEVSPPLGDAYYFYNPFGENLFLDGHLAEDVELGDERYVRDVEAAEELLRGAPVGTYALTYNGFGGRMPGAYRLVRTDHRLSRELSLWRKSSPCARDSISRPVRTPAKRECGLATALRSRSPNGSTSVGPCRGVATSMETAGGRLRGAYARSPHLRRLGDLLLDV